MILIQVLISMLVFYCLECFYNATFIPLYEKLFFLTQIAVLWSFLFYKFRLGVIFRSSTFLSMIRGYLVTISIAGVSLLLELRLFILFGHYSYSSYYILIFCLINLIVLVLFKLLFYKVMRYLRKIGRNVRNVIIIADSSSRNFVTEFLRSKDWGYRVNAILTPDEDLLHDYKHAFLVKSKHDVSEHFHLKGVDDIFYCMWVNDSRLNADEIVSEAEQLGITTHILQSDFAEFALDDNWINKHKTVPFVTYQNTPKKYISIKIKELFDILLSAVILVLTSPLMLLITILIKLEDGGDVFFKQERIGLNGRRFMCFKFRSMVPDAEKLLEQLKDKNESDGPTFKIENDPRVTKIGRLLRKTSLDEFPQFFNVIIGEMSIVGPRPPLLKEVMQYEKYQLRRLSMKPGITCIWQVSGRNAIKFEKWMQLDLDYIDKWSLWLDIKIIFKTIGVVFKANGQ